MLIEAVRPQLLFVTHPAGASKGNFDPLLNHLLGGLPLVSRQHVSRIRDDDLSRHNGAFSGSTATITAADV